MPLQLSAATLVPRPDTETVVELALEMPRGATGSGHRLRLADIGTGSGAILLALLSELPDAYGVGTDISEQALRTANTNAMYLKLTDRAAFVVCDYAAPLSAPFDLIVSNSSLYPLGGNRHPRNRGPRSRSASRAGRWRGRT